MLSFPFSDAIPLGRFPVTEFSPLDPSSAPPRPPNFTSVPAILNALQNEWDALVLETFALRQQYNATRQELSHALYQQDAATRVVARLLKERDSARE
jgi:pre-mRNA-processing factor 19